MDEAPEAPVPDYDTESEPQTPKERPSNQKRVLIVEVQEQLQDKLDKGDTPNSKNPAGADGDQNPAAEQAKLANSEQPPGSEVNESSSAPKRIVKPLRLPDQPATEKLREDLGQLLDSEIDTDVTIQAGRHTFPVHRVILKVRCPELLRNEKPVTPLLPPPPPAPPSSSSCCSGPSKPRRQLKQPAQLEEETPTSYLVELPSPPFTEDLVRGLLRYIYIGRIEVLSGIVEELLVVAGDHKLLELKTTLEKHLCESLDDDNCVRLLVFADEERSQWDCRKLKRNVLKYIKERIRIIVERQEFENLKRGHCKLIEEVLRAVVFGDEWINQYI